MRSAGRAEAKRAQRGKAAGLEVFLLALGQKGFEFGLFVGSHGFVRFFSVGFETKGEDFASDGRVCREIIGFAQKPGSALAQEGVAKFGERGRLHQAGDLGGVCLALGGVKLEVKQAFIDHVGAGGAKSKARGAGQKVVLAHGGGKARSERLLWGPGAGAGGSPQPRLRQPVKSREGRGGVVFAGPQPPDGVERVEVAIGCGFAGSGQKLGAASAGVLGQAQQFGVLVLDVFKGKQLGEDIGPVGFGGFDGGFGQDGVAPPGFKKAAESGGVVVVDGLEERAAESVFLGVRAMREDFVDDSVEAPRGGQRQKVRPFASELILFRGAADKLQGFLGVVAQQFADLFVGRLHRLSL